MRQFACNDGSELTFNSLPLKINQNWFLIRKLFVFGTTKRISAKYSEKMTLKRDFGDGYCA